MVTTKEMMQALIDGEYIKYHTWPKNFFVTMGDDGKLYCRGEREYSIHTDGPWIICKIKLKKKIKTHRWFAIQEDGTKVDGVSWGNCYISLEEAQNAFKHSTYKPHFVKFETEVEIEQT